MIYYNPYLDVLAVRNPLIFDLMDFTTESGLYYVYNPKSWIKIGEL